MTRTIRTRYLHGGVRAPDCLREKSPCERRFLPVTRRAPAPPRADPAAPYNSRMPRLAMAVHGGAYDIPEDQADAHARGCAESLEAGWEVLLAGGSALDAVEAAVRRLEDDPTFDAGAGSHLTRDGRVECDAAI